MPLPMPREGETHDDFVRRCLADDALDEFESPEQKVAVCESQWRKGRPPEADQEDIMSQLRYSHVVRYVYETPWAVLPATLTVILDLLRFRALGGRLTAEEIRERIGAVSREARRGAGSVAVLPLFGVIAHRANMVHDSSGGTSVERFTAQFRQALADPSVGAIVLDVDSPGGTVNGVDELSAEIHRARGQKPIVAIANSLAASAAYWIATAADELVVTPTGEVGAIGVLAAHEDLSAAMEKAGIRTTLISAGKYKGEGTPYFPLGDEAKAAIQERVDDYYDLFTRAVARNRGVSVRDVREGFGEGRVVGARRALRLGMVDRIETLDQVLARLANAGAGRSGSGAALSLAAGPIAPHRSPGIAPDETPWDGPGEVARADAGELHLMCAWYDSTGDDEDGDGYPDDKADYKLPHHRAGDHYLVPRGLYGCAQRLDQTEIPDADRPGVREHLQRHYHELGSKAPWEAMHGDVDLRRRRLRLHTAVVGAVGTAPRRAGLTGA